MERTLDLKREVHLYGRGGASLQGAGTAIYAVHSTAPRATLDGLSVRGFSCVHVDQGALGLQRCTLAADAFGVSVSGAGTRPTLFGNEVTSASYGIWLQVRNLFTFHVFVHALLEMPMTNAY